MTVQTVSCSLMSFAQGSEKVASNNEQNFETFLKTEGNKSPEIKSEKVSESNSVKSNDSEKTEIMDANSFSEVDQTSTGKQMKESEINADAPDGFTLSEGIETEEIILPEEVLAQILSILNEFVVALQHEFQIDEKQLLDSAEMIQFKVMDFFEPDRLKELFLQVNGAEASELLIDENLYNGLEEVQSLLSDILENSELVQLLEKEGFKVDEIDLNVFENQIITFVNGTKEDTTKGTLQDITDDIEVAIDFNDKTSETELGNRDSVFTRESNMEDLSVKTEQGNQTGFETKEQKQSESNQSREQAGLFLQKLVSASNTSLVEGIPEVRGDFNLYDIASQIIEQVKLHIRPENARMEIQLNPEQLGRVELEISSKNGQLSAKMNVQNDQVKEAVESQMQVLRETLEAQGLKVENIEVTVAEFGFRFQDEQGNAQQFQQRQNSSNAIDLDDSTENDEQSFSDVSEVMKEVNGNSVDYVA